MRVWPSKRKPMHSAPAQHGWADLTQERTVPLIQIGQRWNRRSRIFSTTTTKECSTPKPMWDVLLSVPSTKQYPGITSKPGGCDQGKDVQAVHLSSDHPQHLPQQPWKVEPCWKDRTLTQMDQGLENKWAYQRTLWPPWRMIRPRPWEQPWIHARADDWQGTHGRPIHMKICEGRPRMQWIWH